MKVIYGCPICGQVSVKDFEGVVSLGRKVAGTNCRHTFTLRDILSVVPAETAQDKIEKIEAYLEEVAKKSETCQLTNPEFVINGVTRIIRNIMVINQCCDCKNIFSNNFQSVADNQTAICPKCGKGLLVLKNFIKISSND